MKDNDFISKHKEYESNFLSSVDVLRCVKEKKIKKLQINGSNAYVNLTIKERILLFDKDYKNKQDVEIFSIGGYLIIAPIGDKK
jgi:hypothetical protein